MKIILSPLAGTKEFEKVNGLELDPSCVPSIGSIIEISGIGAFEVTKVFYTIKGKDTTIYVQVKSETNMEAKEFQIDDWVMQNGAVLQMLPHMMLQCNFSPIPLTPEILEKNGWIQSKYSTCKNLYEYKGHHLYHAMIKRSNGRWVANVDGQIAKFNCDYDHSYLRINIHYIHELQHALRLCGLTELANNFRVN